MMRPLVMDFPADREAVRSMDEFMFGGSLLVAPVVEHGVTSRTVHFPSGTDWWDFFAEKKIAGGQTLDVKAGLDQVPLYVRAGSVLPIGPDVQYNGEKPWDDLEVRVYPGADGSFTLYEDDFETYACERGEFSTIRFDWNDAARTLKISERGGAAYSGRIEKRRFRVRLPGGEAVPVEYDGKAISVKL
jgi:alpha-D-xyloside xylohydrolase